MRVLVADDDRGNVELQVRLLQREGHHAFRCYHGADVMEMVERLRPDVLLLDLAMPDLSGYEIAEELRLNPDLRPECVIAVTGYDRDSDRARTAEAGFDHHLVKPVSWDQLQAVLESHDFNVSRLSSTASKRRRNGVCPPALNHALDNRHAMADDQFGQNH